MALKKHHNFSNDRRNEKNEGLQKITTKYQQQGYDNATHH